MKRFVLAAALLLAACGQPPAENAPAPAQPQVLAPPTPQEIAEALVALPAPYNAGDYENGRRVFAQCRSCHVIAAGAGNRIGPNLHGLWGARAAHIEGFRYSPAMQSAGLTWDGPTIDRYLENPRAAVPGTIMVFPGVRDAQDRRDIVAYLAIESQR